MIAYIRMIKKIVILLIVLMGCNQLVGTGSFIHAIATGNTLGQILGVTDFAIKKETGKTVGEHMIDAMTNSNKDKLKSKEKKTLEQDFIEMEGEN